MHAFAMKRTILLSALLLVLLAMAFWLWSAMTGNDHRTDDAWVNADYTLVAPKVSGYIAHVNVQDNQRVRAGDVLATLDDRDYRVARVLERPRTFGRALSSCAAPWPELADSGNGCLVW